MIDVITKKHERTVDAIKDRLKSIAYIKNIQKICTVI
jgi:hypothetical protein